jgi:hypothetical protein
VWTLSQPGTGVIPWNIVSTGLAFNANTSLISITDTTGGQLTFAGASLNYYGVQFNRGTTGFGSSQSIIITGSNGFVNFSDIGAVTHNLFFTAATTQTIGNFSVSGSPTCTITLNSPTNGTFFLQKSPAGLVNCDYLTILHSTATPSNTWYAGTNSVNYAANSGWIFTNIPPRKMGSGGVG